MTISVRTILVSFLLAASSATVASAQTADRPLGDTLRFATTMKSVQTITDSPMGPVENAMESYMRSVLTFGAADTVRMWVDSATYVMTTPMGDVSPDISFMLNKVFVGILNADGTVRTIKTPDLLPEEAAQFGTMMPEQGETFPFVGGLPDAPLKSGFTWTDTIITTADPDAEQKMSSTNIVTSTVVGDSILYGHPVVIIESASEADIEMDMTMADGMMTMKNTMKQTTLTRQFYSPAYRLYLMATSSGTGTSKQVVEGPMSMTMNGTQTTESTATLIR